MADYIINANGDYFEPIPGRPLRPGEVAVPQRPGPWDTWDGSAWQAGAAPIPAQYLVPWLTFLDRLSDANADAALTFMSTLNAKQSERIKARGVPNDHGGIRNWLTNQAEDPDIILGWPT
jgi:hypothetical protein